jgi:hypothetical protein
MGCFGWIYGLRDSRIVATKLTCTMVQPQIKKSGNFEFALCFESLPKFLDVFFEGQEFDLKDN